MGIKQSLKNVAGRIGISAENVRSSVVPQWGEFTDYYQNMAMNPQGYSSEVLNAMRGAATGGLAGQRRSQQQDLNRQVAASGMGRTGIGMRKSAQLGRDFASQVRRANYDVDVANAEAMRDNMWKAAQAWGGGIGGQQSAWGDAARIEGMQVPALTGAHDVSFWGDWKDVTGGIGNLMGGTADLIRASGGR